MTKEVQNFSLGSLSREIEAVTDMKRSGGIHDKFNISQLCEVAAQEVNSVSLTLTEM